MLVDNSSLNGLELPKDKSHYIACRGMSAIENPFHGFAKTDHSSALSTVKAVIFFLSCMIFLNIENQNLPSYS